jgi:hypothetical protein
MTLGSSGAGSSVVGEEFAPLLLLLFPDGYLSPEISRSDPVLLQFWLGAPALDLAPRDPIRVKGAGMNGCVVPLYGLGRSSSLIGWLGADSLDVCWWLEKRLWLHMHARLSAF